MKSNVYRASYNATITLKVLIPSCDSIFYFIPYPNLLSNVELFSRTLEFITLV
jgi:hypothetical protein